MLLDTLSRFVHVSTAIVLVGGSIFMLWVLMPAALQISSSEHDKLRGLVVARWKRFVHLGIALFLISGLYNYMQAIPKHKGDGAYHALLGTKMLLAFAVFFIASVLVGRSTKFEAMRNARGKWLAIIILLSAIIVGISSYVKVNHPPKADGNQIVPALLSKLTY